MDNINFIKEPLTVEESQEYFDELMLVLNYAVSFLDRKSSKQANKFGAEDGSLSHNE